MHAIRLDNAVFEGENVVYLLDPDDGPTTLVDAGAPTERVRDSLRDGLSEAGVAVADLDRILLTHWHWDHSGLAGELQADSGATVHVHERDAPLVDGSGREAFRERRHRCFERWGIPEEPLAELTAFLERHADLAGEPADVTTFTHGERFAFADDGADGGGRSDEDTVPAALRAVHLPGHADGLTAFVAEDRHEAFVGDVLLPEYTPNVGGADPRVERPLPAYRASLRWLAAADLDVAYPGHRDPIEDPAGRAEEILAHHVERTDRTRAALAELEPATPSDSLHSSDEPGRTRSGRTPWQVSDHLFGDLENIHVMHGPGEAWAHLEALRDEGEVERETVEGCWQYRRAPGPHDRPESDVP